MYFPDYPKGVIPDSEYFYKVNYFNWITSVKKILNTIFGNIVPKLIDDAKKNNNKRFNSLLKHQIIIKPEIYGVL